MTIFEARALTDEVKAHLEAALDGLARLYEDNAHLTLGYRSWAAYCEAEYGWAKPKAYRLLGASRIAAELPNGNSEPRPRNEAIYRELAALRASPAQMREVWAEALKRHGEKATAAQVRAIVLEVREGRKRLRDLETAKRIEEMKDAVMRASAITANHLGAVADELPGDGRAWLDEVERDALQAAAIMKELARLVRAVRDEPISFYEGYGETFRRDGVAPTLLASDVPLVFFQPGDPGEPEPGDSD